MLSDSRTIQKGMTLIELMIAIAVFALLIGIALPSYQSWIQNTKVRNVAESLQNGLQLSRAEAVRRNASVTFTLGPGSGWTVGCATATANCPAILQSRSSTEGSTTAVVVTPLPSTATSITFNSFGAIASAGLTQMDVSTPQGNRPLRILIVGGGGTVKMCDPSTSLPSSDPRKCP
ncbi:GspH/FimT family pseudopilin [Sulfurirhabdus autotrophica]|uniref:Type II secretion system protein H n=1 Tax=Sulfurirhabdus autotrophica TaxID=1706046 RepID=A0A4R3YER0_9PROT|nr:GspH/FimT family pseudopilin [Sulfurirhabdus autotrophica]TCV88953.1 type IV fimbrial biogenesis protein FimT [Sulfurirhabdus autotrophica]